MNWLPMIGLGVGAGVVGGMFGIGGGLIIVPALVLAFKLDQPTAIGTSLLAQLLPVGLLAVRDYHQRGQVDFPRGCLIAAGLVVGTLAGARLAGTLSPLTMKRVYGAFLIVVGTYFLVATGPAAADRSSAASEEARPAPDHLD